MARRLAIAISLIAVFAGCSKSREDYAPMAEFVATADQVTLYEGLPRQSIETEVLEQELAQKETFQIGDYDFYSEPMPLTKDDEAVFTNIFDGIDAFTDRTPGETKCDPYHPDFCLEWRHGDEFVRIQICFGCGESKIYSEAAVLYLCLSAEAYEELKLLLKDRWQNRPKTKIAIDNRD